MGNEMSRFLIIIFFTVLFLVGIVPSEEDLENIRKAREEENAETLQKIDEEI